MGASRGKRLPTAGSAAASSAGASISPTAIYVYCVVRGSTVPVVDVRAARLPDAGRPRTVPLARRTWLVVADVPMKVYGAVPLAQRLKDLDWVGTVGVAHQAMVDACMRHDVVVPMKVFTLFKTVTRARAEMRRHAEGLRQAMQQVAGCVEWGVRVTRATQPARDLVRRTTQPWVQPGADGPATDEPPSGAALSSASPSRASLSSASGRAFLEAKVRHRNAVREEAAVLDGHVRTLAHTLDEMTRDARYRLDPTRGRVPVLLDASYLVPRRSEKQFRAQVRAKSQPLLARGCRVTVSGPWPAYSFVSPDGR